MRRVPGSSVVAGMFGVKAAAAAFEKTIRAAISATTAAAENSSATKLKTQSESLQTPQNNHQSFGLGVANYRLSMFAQHTDSPAKTPKQTRNNILPFEPRKPTI